jgi:hypothetical protein
MHVHKVDGDSVHDAVALLLGPQHHPGRHGTLQPDDLAQQKLVQPLISTRRATGAIWP